MKKPITEQQDLSVQKHHSFLSAPTLRELRARLQHPSGMRGRRK